MIRHSSEHAGGSWPLRLIALFTVAAGLNYVIWRWMSSVNWRVWWISVPLVIAESYSLIEVMLFAVTMWRVRRRSAPPELGRPTSVDVFVTTYDEPVELVLHTVRSAIAITYPHKTWILDDGDRDELRDSALALKIGYIRRGPEWRGKERHAKAGNLNAALPRTDGEFILILDADMVPRPNILDKTLGYFSDERVALVQTPQVFRNVPGGDPLGSQAPLFYGPIQEGKDGWNAAFFCGSNAVLRREALMQLGISDYVSDTEKAVGRRLRMALRVVHRARRVSRSDQASRVLDAASQALNQARTEIAEGRSLSDVTYTLQRAVDDAVREVVAADLSGIQADLSSLSIDDGAAHDDSEIHSWSDESLMEVLSGPALSPFNALRAVQNAVRAIDVTRPGEAHAVLPLATISVTEDMATSMRLHAHGWRSVFCDTVLADGLAPEDLSSMITQRLRWAQGTMQVFFRENPLFLRGLTWGQRLMYFSTMWSYLSGFATVIYLAAPAFFLLFGVMPVNSYSLIFFLHFLPFLISNQVLFLVAAHGLPTWRGQQYSLALFPVWIKACVSALGNVVFHRPLAFAVTPKNGIRSVELPLARIRWQVGAAIVLACAIVAGVIRIFAVHVSMIAIVVNLIWVIYDFASLSVLIAAVRYHTHRAKENSID